MSPPDIEVFVRKLDAPESSLEFGPPLVAPGAPNASAEVEDDIPYAPASRDADLDQQPSSVVEASPELIPVSWSTSATPGERTLPTNEVWDDTGWHSER